MMFLRVLAVVAVLGCASADMYLHNPRGSNNRLNGANRDRSNANRLFDSQNNARGGYNVGNLYYYAGSVLPIQWTNQHSCNDPNNNCEIIIQYMCNDQLRDGTTEGTIPENRRQCRNSNCNTDLRFGMHEDFQYYSECKIRQRNRGVFVADQNLKGDTAKFTRQNPGGTRRGYECPEERDYYPYWHSSPWKDIVVMTNDVKRCNYYKSESQNVKSRWGCLVPKGYFTCDEHLRNLEIPNTKERCENIRYPPGDPAGEKGVWHEYPANGDPSPDCIHSPWSRDNHNGNGRSGYMNTYNWTVPNIEANSCVMRIRYNISTNDYDSWNTGASSVVNIGAKIGLEEQPARERGYIFKNNPVVSVSKSAPKLQLRLAINTAQFGRTFQDRTHVFSIEKPSKELLSAKIHNLNVRGKRGNIVQTYPAMEYDYVPNTLHVKEGDYVHFQWTGSDRNPRNNAGEGRAGTDRSNVLLLENQIYPEGKPKINVFGQYGRNYPKNISEATFLGMPKVDLKMAAILHPGSGPTLDEAGTYFDLGPRKVTGAGTYFYMCTRNNNFSNRSQKGKIHVKGKEVAGGQAAGKKSDEVADSVVKEKENMEDAKEDAASSRENAEAGKTAEEEKSIGKNPGLKKKDAVNENGDVIRANENVEKEGLQVDVESNEEKVEAGKTADEENSIYENFGVKKKNDVSKNGDVKKEGANDIRNEIEKDDEVEENVEQPPGSKDQIASLSDLEGTKLLDA